MNRKKSEHQCETCEHLKELKRNPDKRTDPDNIDEFLWGHCEVLDKPQKYCYYMCSEYKELKDGNQKSEGSC